jgi:hypothetical protein
MMDEKTSLKYEMLGALSGPLFVAIYVITFGFLGHNLPSPPSPALNPADLSAWYAKNLSDLRLGWVVSLVFISLYMPWSAQISTQMRRIETHSTILTYLQLIGGALTVFVVSFGMLCWAVATFRPDRDPAIVQMLSDLGWESLELQWALTTMQMVAMALVGLGDKRKTPLFPRWVCFLSIWCGLSFVPASLTLYLKTGPFAWDGLLSFYIPYAAWLVWCLAISIDMAKDVRRRMREVDAGVPRTAGAAVAA